MRRLISLSVFLCLSLLIHAGISRLLTEETPGHSSARSVQVSLTAIKDADKPSPAMGQNPGAAHRQEAESLPDAGPAPVPGPDIRETAAPDAPREREEHAAGRYPDILTAAFDSIRAADIYREKVMDIIRANLSYPKSARTRGLEGTVRVCLTIGGSGTADGILIEKTSGFPTLDRASIRTIEKCTFPPPPDSVMVLHIPITFRLVEKP